MHGDFSRSTFDRSKHYSGVLAQQGRVTLDADLNEQAAIQQHLLRMFVADMVGQHGGPRDALGFRVTLPTEGAARGTVHIGSGRYYVDGIPAENDRATDFWGQPERYLDQVADHAELPSEKAFLVYLKVWERMLTAVGDPDLREVALGDFAPDTATRGKVTWQVIATEQLPGGKKLSELQPGQGETLRGLVEKEWTEWRARDTDATKNYRRLKADAKPPANANEKPCNAAPDARYRGLENQLYRVEIHTGGAKPTFTWSRENGSVVFPVAAVAGQKVRLASAGRDHKLDLDVGDWVEFVDDAYAVRGKPANLLQVEDIDAEREWITLNGPVQPAKRTLHPYLRRWDQRPEPAKPGSSAPPAPTLAADNAITLVENVWIDLEDGVQIMFQPGGTYTFGDYWLIPARTLLGDVQWPQDPAGTGPAFVDAHGVTYHYAPLAFVPAPPATGTVTVEDLRKEFGPQAEDVVPPPAPATTAATAKRKS